MRARAYRDFVGDLSSMLGAGIPLPEALHNLASAPGRRGFARALAGRVAGGASLGEALRAEGVSAVDVALVRAGEESGKLVETLNLIVGRHDARQALWDDLVRRGLYGVCVLILACCLLPLYLVVLGRTGTYFLIQAVVFGPVLVIAWLVRRGPELFRASSACREAYEKLLLGLPIVGALQARVALSRAFEVLGLLLQAGLSYRDGIPLAAESIGWRRLRVRMLRVAEDIEAGKSVTEALLPFESDVASSDWRQRLAGREAAGKVDLGFLEIARGWEESFVKDARMVLRALPIFLILLVGSIVFFRMLALMERFTGSP